MEIITYSLKDEHHGSQEYYNTVRDFTDEVLLHAEDTLTGLIDEYKEYLHRYQLENVRETGEYILEMLSFGVLWKQYASTALSVNHAPFISMAYMAEWRKKHQFLKPYIDTARGILTTLLLLPEKKEENPSGLPTLDEIDHVCKWFEATGEFREQALRFICWRAFWQTKNQVELNRIFFAIYNFTLWFEERALKVLGKYTENVDKFLRISAKHYLWREDRISCTRSRAEYHLNMVGAELMNRAFRQDFKKTENKAVLLPGCMRFHQSDKCKAVKVPGGLKCEGCQNECRVNQLREMGKKYNFETYILPHASDLSLWSPQKGMPSRGVIASACLTTLVEGGWELKRYDVPAQCVVLDFCGCSKHWHSEGITTELDIKELKRILQSD